MKLRKDWKYVVEGLPLAGAVGTVFLPLHRLQQQFVILIVLIWIQVFFITNIFLVNRRTR